MAEIEQNIEQLNELIEKIQTTQAKIEEVAGKSITGIKEAGGLIGNQYREIMSNIDEAFGKQADFLTAQELANEVQIRLIEKEKQIREKIISQQKEQVAAAKALLDINESVAQSDAKRERQLQKIKDRIQELNQKIQDGGEQLKNNRGAYEKIQEAIEAQKEKEADILERREDDERRIAKLKENAINAGIKTNEIEDDAKELSQDRISKLIDERKEQTKNLVEAQKASDKQSKTQSEISDKLKNQNLIIDDAIGKFTGLKVSTGGFLDLLLEATEEEEGLVNLGEKLKKRLERATDPVVILATAFSKVVNIVNDLSEKINEMTIGIKSAGVAILEIPITFERETGLGSVVAENLREISRTSAEAGFLLGETDVAFRGLSKSMSGFTRMGSESRKFLTEQSALLARAGVSAGAFGNSVDGLMKSMNMSDRSAASLTEEIAGFGKVVGIDADSAVTDFANNLDLLATFGEQKGVAIFKKLAIAANEAGVEIQTLNSIANKFETFDSAMRSAGKLNFILRGPFLNSMELLQATPERTLEILRKGFDDAGKSFDDFGRRGREAIASTLGVSVDVARRLFDDRSIKSAKELETSLMNRARGEGKLTDELRDKLTLQQKQELLFERLLQILMPVSEVFYDISEALLEMGEILAPVLAYFGGFVSIMKVLVPLFLVFVSMKALGGVVSLAFSAAQGLMAMGGAVGWVGTATTAMGGLALAIAGVASAYLMAASAKEDFKKGETGRGIAKIGAGIGIGTVLGGLALIGAGIATGGAAFAIAGAASAGAAGLAFLNDGVDDYKPGISGVQSGASRMRRPPRRPTNVGVAMVGDGPGGRMLPTTEAVSLKQGDAVLNSGDVASMTEAIRALPNVLAAFTEAANRTNETAIAIAKSAADKGGGGENPQLNLVIKMDEREIGRISRKVSMETLERGLQIPLK